MFLTEEWLLQPAAKIFRDVGIHELGGTSPALWKDRCHFPRRQRLGSGHGVVLRVLSHPVVRSPERPEDAFGLPKWRLREDKSCGDDRLAGPIIEARAVQVVELPLIEEDLIDRIVRLAREVLAVLVTGHEYVATGAVDVGVVSQGAQIPVLDLEDGDAYTGMQQHDVGSQSVEVRLDVDFPFSWELQVEEIDHLPLTVCERRGKLIEFVPRGINDPDVGPVV